MAVASLRSFFLEKIAPVVCNQAVTEVQERLQMRVCEIDIEAFEEPFTYWTARAKPGQRG